jgi:two-component system, LytTR family, response regulator
MNKPLKAIIVDDERLARNRLRLILAEHPTIQVVAEADSVKTALAAIRTTKPDVLFLDIQMPGETGFDLVNQLGRAIKIIFVTAFDEYAIRAFEVNALDYLLKPVNPERLALAIEKLQQTAAPAVNFHRPLEYDDFIFLTVGESSRFLRVSLMRCIRAAGMYSEIITSDGQKLLILKPLSEWEERLPEKFFARIHRSTIINIECVERIEKAFNYSYQVHLRGIAEPLTMSRRHAAKLKEKLG